MSTSKPRRDWRVRGASGKFTRTRQPWDPERWDDGCLDNKGRFRVYRPDFPGVGDGGYVFRYHVVYWLATGQTVPEGYVLHHLNGDRTDDRFENLELMPHGTHSRLHNLGRSAPPVRTCPECHQRFQNHNTRFCSQECYHAHPRSEAHKAAQAAGIKRAYAEGRR